MKNQTPYVVAFLALHALFSMFAYKLLAEVEENRKVHIVYLGERQYGSKLTSQFHHDLLATLLGSMEKSSESMVYSYRHGFSGFAAKLTKSQAQKLAEMPGVARVFPNVLYKLQTTRSWDSLRLFSYPFGSNLLHRGNLGDGVIIGVLDSGIWPESEAFSDKGLGPIPSRWKGICESGEQFNATNCNRKIIGARWYLNGFISEFGRQPEPWDEYLSPRDAVGHGTHVASTAAGSFVRNISYRGLGAGTVRGGAPGARLAIYKVCWAPNAECSAADILKAFDQAIHDGVDVLSLSLGPSVPLFPEFDEHDGVAIGSFHAIARGISVVCAAGNEGSLAHTVVNTAPWILTVAASSIDRTFLTSVTLGDNTTFLGQSLFTGKNIEAGLTYPDPEELKQATAGLCDSISPNGTSIKGKVVLCFVNVGQVVDYTTTRRAAAAVSEANGIGLIIVGQHDGVLSQSSDHIPCIVVDVEIGTNIFFYIKATRNPLVKLSPSKTIVGNPVSMQIPYFSSRGPNSVAPTILKPDVAAPGANILAASSPHDPFTDRGYAIYSGTSMATPHISGIIALLKFLHPHWSPAAIKSALITTAWTTHPSGVPIFAEGSPPKVADPFDYGGGIVNPNEAGNPGLVYDMDTTDYINYICSMGYNNSAISLLTEQKTECPRHKPSMLDVNLPSITIPALRNSTTVARTVTNVGNSTSIYRAVIKSPPGTKVTVQPDVLVFSSKVKKISFKITVSTALLKNYGFSFGSLTWTDGVHVVRSPLSVRTKFF